MSSFMLGYHVHEKAILTPMIFQLFLSVISPQDGFLALLLTQVGTYSLFPLFTGLQELPLKGEEAILNEILFLKEINKLSCSLQLFLPVSLFLSFLTLAHWIIPAAGGFEFSNSQKRCVNI